MTRVLFALCCLLFVGCIDSTDKQSTKEQSSYSVNDSSDRSLTDTIPMNAKKVILAYPDQVISYSNNAIVFADGTKIVYNDGREKGFVEKLDECDIEDMFSMNYDTVSSIPSILTIADVVETKTFSKKCMEIMK